MQLIKNYLLFSLTLFLIIVLVACNPSEEVVVNDSPLPTSTTDTVVADSPLPTPTSSSTPIPSPTPMPTPSVGKGVIGGTLMWSVENTALPASNATLFLGSIVAADDGTPMLVGLDEKVDVSTTTDAFGRYTFVDVEPGVYGLIYQKPTQDFMLLGRENNTKNLLITVKADDIVEVEEVVIPFPF